MFAVDARIAVTGTGICTSIGNSAEEVVESLLASRSGIAPFAGDGVERMVSKFAAIHSRFELDHRFRPGLKQWWDRATQMGAMAATDAVARSGILESGLERNRIGMAIGVSGAGQFSPNRDYVLDAATITPEIAELLLRRNVPHYQLYQIARWLNLGGPMTALCSASAGSGIAIGNGVRWLLSGQADAVVAGGSEAVMLLNFLGFDTLGLLSSEPCSPFSRCDGMSMGEGAAYVVLERLNDAVRRKADIRGVLLGFGVTSDAFDPIQFDPTGDGIRRAMTSAIEDSNLQPNEIDWIRASGAGGRDQDASEVMALRSVFGGSIPLVTSTEANFGHCNGSGPAIGLVAAIEMQRCGWIPPTLNSTVQSFPDIDFVPNHPRKMVAKNFLSTTAAFGGTNVVLVGGNQESYRVPIEWDEVVVSGMGLVSGFGCAPSDFAKRMETVDSFIGPIDRKGIDAPSCMRAGLVKNFSFRREAPSIPTRGLDLLTQYSVSSALKALSDSESHGQKIDRDRLGVVTGIAHTSGTALEKLFEEIRGPWASPTIGRALLNKGRFLVTSRLAHYLNCRGYNATHSGGIGCGQVALNQAYEQLRQSSSTDAIVVVAADEVSRTKWMFADQLGWLARPCNNNPVDGMFLGEGAVAIVLERKSAVIKRGGRILATIAAASSSLDELPFDASFDAKKGPPFQLDYQGTGLESALRMAIDRGGPEFADPDLFLGSECGLKEVDHREREVIDRVFSNAMAYGSTSKITGVQFSSGSLFSLCMGISAMHDEATCEILNRKALASGRTIRGCPDKLAILATSEDGHNVVTFLRRQDVNNILFEKEPLP